MKKKPTAIFNLRAEEHTCEEPEYKEKEACTCSDLRKFLGIKTKCRCGAINDRIAKDSQ